MFSLPALFLALLAGTAQPSVQSTEPVLRAQLAGKLLLPDGRPAQGALVISSLGGQAESLGDGSFALDLEYSADEREVQLTAVLTPLGSAASLSASLHCTLPLHGGALALGARTLGAAAGLPEWLPTFGGEPGTSGQIVSLAVLDEGTGPVLYAAGQFNSIGGVAANYIARWDGSGWAPLGSGTNTFVRALITHDDGSGPALYVGGDFSSAGGVPASYLARWKGGVWSGVGGGTNGVVDAFAIYDDGSGSGLIVSGQFSSAGGMPASRIARWKGGAWSALGSGLGGPAYAATAYDDGSGNALYVAGSFTQAGGQPANRVARWNGSQWSALGSGVNGVVSTLLGFDDGNGPALFVGGSFTTAGGQPALRIATWRNSSWSSPGTPQWVGSSINVFSLCAFDDGGGAKLYAGFNGEIFNSPGAVGIASWDGASWSEVDGGTDAYVRSLEVYDDGQSALLVAGGIFEHAGDLPASAIAGWNGSQWSTLGGPGLNERVLSLAAFNDGQGMALYAGGTFTGAKGKQLNHIARWNGAGWMPLDAGVDGAGFQSYPAVHDMIVFDDGTGIALYAAGTFKTAGGSPAENIARWDGTSWSPLGAGTNGTILDMAVFDDGSGKALYVVGSFTIAGGLSISTIARWNGTTWSAVGGLVNGGLRSLAVLDDGGGPDLYVGGTLSSAGGVPAENIARWDGTAWSAVGSGLNGSVTVMRVYNDGTGAALYAGGSFTNAGAIFTNHIARWDGAAWSGLGNGLSDTPYALAVFDDGSGGALYAGGLFLAAGGVLAARIARWDGMDWSALGAGLGVSVEALYPFDDTKGPALFVGGAFTTSTAGDSYLARWGSALPSSGTTYCSTSLTTSGCAPAISALGNASASAGSGFVLSVTAVEGQRIGLLIYAQNGATALPWAPGSSSVLCVQPPVLRMTGQNSLGTLGACDGRLVEDWNTFIAGGAFQGGETVWAQGWFRDPLAPLGSNFSDALVFSVDP